MEDLIGGTWVAWRELPETQEFLRGIREATQDNKDNWANGFFNADSEYSFLKENFMAQGETRFAEKILDQVNNIKLIKDAENGE